MLREERYYSHSGRFGLVGIVGMTLAGGLTGIVLGPVYGVISCVNPYVYLNVVLSLVLAFACGCAVSFGGRAGKVRNLSITCVWGLLAGLVALYANWVGWMYAASGWEAVVLDPAAQISVLRTLAEEGAWTIFGWTPKGAALWLFWLAEAGIIVIVAGLTAHVMSAGRPFCERCERWVVSQELKPYTLTGEPAEIAEKLEREEYDALGSFARAPEGTNPHVEFELKSCPACGDFHLVSVKLVEEIVKSKKEKSKEETVIVENLIVDGRAHELIRNLPAAPPQPEATGEQTTGAP